jgi:hypothetical protein
MSQRQGGLKMQPLQFVQHRKLDQSTVNIRPDLGKPENQEAESFHESSEVLHPAQVADEQNAQAQTRDEKIEAVCDFIGRIAGISDGEFGDWQRRATLYWWHLTDALHGENQPKVHAALKEMIRIIDFNPNFLILETSRQVTALAMQIR